jgi:GMP synthase-like glutamine amidotransferase
MAGRFKDPAMQGESDGNADVRTRQSLLSMITILQHGRDESAGEIEPCLEEFGRSFTIVRLYETNEVPVEVPASLIILGGQMSVNDTPEYPYFLREKEMIREMVIWQRPVLGICLGAQMIASAFGERVFRSLQERGWHRVNASHPENSFSFPHSCSVFHWHKETFKLPKEATLILEGDQVKNQAFRLGSAVGVQFHPEVTTQIISRWCEELGPEERRLVLQDTEHEIAGNKLRCRALMKRFLNGWDS